MDCRTTGDLFRISEQIAAGIFAAVTDGKNQLRYPLGDAEQTLQVRAQVGDDAFMAAMRQQIFG